MVPQITIKNKIPNEIYSIEFVLIKTATSFG
jgi:hypothetical protein